MFLVLILIYGSHLTSVLVSSSTALGRLRTISAVVDGQIHLSCLTRTGVRECWRVSCLFVSQLITVLTNFAIERSCNHQCRIRIVLEGLVIS